MSASYHGAMARTDTASRVIAAPPDRVFAALVDPEALTAWLPPDGMSGRFERFDARPGGSYRLVLTYADASSARGKATADSDIVEAHFVDVVPGVRVVQAVDFVSDDPTHAGTMTMTWEVTALDAGTRVDIRSLPGAWDLLRKSRGRPYSHDFFLIDCDPAEHLTATDTPAVFAASIGFDGVHCCRRCRAAGTPYD